MIMKRTIHFLFFFILYHFSFPIYGQDSTRILNHQQYFYQNGVLSSEGTLLNGKPEGYWKAYYSNGILKSEGNRKNFELDGTWKFYTETGKLFLEVNYLNGKKNGYKTSYFDKEIVTEHFVNDIKQNETRIYYPDGKLKMTIPFVNGIEQGFGKEYDHDETVITLTEYKRGFIIDRKSINRRDKEGRKQGKWYLFWENGKIKVEGNYKNDKKEGYFKEYTELGDLLRISKYQNDILQPDAQEIVKLDVYNEYYSNGKIKSSKMYRNGVLEGVSKTFDTTGKIIEGYVYGNGVILSEGIIDDEGNKNGPWKDLFPDGTTRAIGKYEDGKKIGTWKYYYPNGQIEQTGKYSLKGKLDGAWKWFFENGSLLKEEFYRNGVRDGISIEYDETGKIIEEGEFVNGLEEGLWYESNGDFYTRGNYTDGLKSGNWIQYTLIKGETKTDSILSFKGNFIEDLPDGKHVRFWDNGKKKEEGLFIMGKREGEWFQYNYDGTIFLVITYRQGVEIKYDGVKIKPPFESEQ